jgi:hypothetical protein
MPAYQMQTFPPLSSAHRHFDAMAFLPTSGPIHAWSEVGDFFRSLQFPTINTVATITAKAASEGSENARASGWGRAAESSNNQKDVSVVVQMLSKRSPHHP